MCFNTCHTVFSIAQMNLYDNMLDYTHSCTQITMFEYMSQQNVCVLRNLLLQVSAVISLLTLALLFYQVSLLHSILVMWSLCI